MPLIVLVLIVLLFCALFGGCWDREQATRKAQQQAERIWDEILDIIQRTAPRRK